MNRVHIDNAKKLLLIPVVLCFFMTMQAQNEHITIDPVSQQEFTVTSINGIPYTIVLEESNNDGQFHLGSNNSRLTFKTEDLIGKRSTLRIVFEEEMYHSLEDKLIEQYKSDVEWIETFLEITDKELKLFPTRPVFNEHGLEKLKARVFEYATTPKKEEVFNEWIEKINYSVGAVRYFRDLYAASNGENNEQRHNFLPINIYEELQKKR